MEQHETEMDAALFPQDRIAPDVLRELTPAEAVVLRILLAQDTFTSPRPKSKGFNRLVKEVLRKVGAQNRAELERCVVMNPSLP